MRKTKLDKLLTAMRDSKGVPASERSAASVLSALDSPNEGKPELVQHIIEDFSLTQKVLQLANSSMYAPFTAGSASVSAALDGLGSEAVLHLVLGAELASDEAVLKDDNLSRTLMASELARSACTERAEDASIATLMVEIGRLMSTKYLASETQDINRRVAAGTDAQDAARAVLGMSYQELGLELAARWNLPDTLRATLDGSGDATLAGIARFSSTASGLIQAGHSEAAARLLQQLDLPGVDKSRLGALVSRKGQEAGPARTAPVSAEVPLKALLERLLQEKKATIEDLAGVLLPGLADALQTAHCLLFMLTRSGEQRVRNGYGKGIDELKTRLKISAEFMPTAFHAAIKNNIDVSIGDVSKLKDASLPEGYRALLPHVSKFIILPIGGKRVTGLLYCDWDSGRALSQTEMDAVKQLRDLLVPMFPQ
jgi:HD-like signal output (HDOD) protein